METWNELLPDGRRLYRVVEFSCAGHVISFASYHLWLHRRKPALHLANLFTAYQPGIRYSQVQMQSGTTGINAIRIYNIIKQEVDQGPEGVFILHWILELREIDQSFIHTPWASCFTNEWLPYIIPHN